ncbi:MAG TPA: cytochrome c biogenesis CcdA family protein, partial [Limnochordia bacterium]|nr:cytochrome c biogenesis CcdA family protein [Limnochordia bacterium]
RHGAAFVIGFSTVFIALGWAAGSLGQLFYHYQHPIRWVGGLIIILFGLSTLLGWELPLLGRTVRWQGRAQPGPLVASWFVGLTFAAGWTPCVGPILGSILVLAGTSPHTAIGLMAAYSAGLALPFLLMAYGVGAAAWFKRHSLRLQRAAGAMMTAVGVMLATGEFDRLAAWLTSALGFTVIG